MADASVPLDENDRRIMEMMKDRKVIVLLNKTDLMSVVTEEELKGILPEHPVIAVSAREQTGFEALEEALKDMFFSGEISFNDEIYITNMRQKEALMEAKESLEQVQSSIEMQMPEDFYSIDLMAAYEALGRITGETVGEDLIQEIFGKFCMGK